jgi:transposase
MCNKKSEYIFNGNSYCKEHFVSAVEKFNDEVEKIEKLSPRRMKKYLDLTTPRYKCKKCGHKYLWIDTAGCLLCGNDFVTGGYEKI